MNTRETPELVCSNCRQVLVREYEFGRMDFEDAERWAAVQLARHKHVCNEPKRCSGYGFFPGADRCPGCPDCNPTLNILLQKPGSNQYEEIRP